MRIIHNLEDIKEKKVLFFDLDDTLIETVSGKTFAEDVSDFRIRLDVLNVIRNLSAISKLFIVTNQDNLGERATKEDFEAKFNSILTFIKYYVNVGKTSGHKIEVDGLYCSAKGYNSKNRKPNTGMLERCLKGYTFEKETMLMCGDASGIHNDDRDDISDSDYRTARNFDIDYIDIEDFRSL